MAETYKGLTIRIGGDTTKLQSALRSADSAISNTQAQLRKMSQAVKMDPTSLTALNRQMELTGQRAVEIATRLSQLRSAVKEISGQKVDLLNGAQSTKTIGQLADETEDASKRAADAKTQYNAINAELERMYKQINVAAKASGEFDDKFDVREQILSFGQMRDQLVQAGAATEQQIDRINELRAAWEGAFNENEIAKAVYQMEDLNSEAIKAEASFKQVNQQFSDMSRANLTNNMFAKLNEDIERVQLSSEKAEDRLSRLQSAVELDPTNIETVRLALDSIDDATASAEAKMDLLRQKVASFEAAGIDKLADGMDDTALAAQKAADEYTQVTEQVNRCEGEIRSLTEQQRQFEAAGDTSSDRYRELGEQIDAASTRLEELTARQRELQAVADNSALVQEYKDAQVEIAETSAQLQKLKQAQSEITGWKGLSSNTLMELGMTLSTTVTPAIMAFGANAIESAQEIDSAYRDMRKTVNGTEDDFARLKQAAIEFSTTSVTSADQILSIQAIGGELGVATDDLQVFAETVSNLDIATDLDAEEAATALGQLDNIMNDLSGATMPQFSDALVRLGNNGASTETQIIDIAKRIGSMASIIGMSTPEVLAWASSIASTGQNAEAAGTAISNTMADIESAVAVGGDSLQAFAEVAGMSAQQFTDAWNSDPSTAMKSFIEGLKNVEADGGSATATLADLGITATRQVQAIEGLMQTIDGLDDNLQMSNDAWNGVSDQWGEAGDAANEAAKKAEGFSGAIARMQNMAQVLGSEIAGNLTPFINALSDALGTLTDWFIQLPSSVQMGITALGGLAAAMGPLLLMRRALGSLKEDFDGFSTGIKAAMSSADGFAGVLSNLKGGLIGLGVGVAVGALASFIQVCYEAWETQQKFNDSIEDFSDAASDSASLNDYSVSIDDIRDSADGAVPSIDQMTESLNKYAEAMQTNTDAAKSQINQLTTAQGIINTYAGVSDLSAEAQGRLQWAIDLVNDQLGLSITQADVLNDSYTDQNGVVHDLTDSVNALAEAKKNEARVNALSENLTTAYQAQEEAASNLAQAQAAYNEKVQDYLDDGLTLDQAKVAARSYTEAGKALQAAEQGFDEASKAVRDNEEALGVAAGAASEAADAYDALSGTMDSADFSLFSAQLEQNKTTFSSLKDDLRELGANTDQFAELSQEDLQKVADAYNGTSLSLIDALRSVGVQMDWTKVQAVESAVGIRESLLSWGDGEIQEVLSQTGIDLDVLSLKLAESATASANMSQITQEQFAAMASAAGGDVNRLIFMIENYNSTPIYNKDGEISVDDTELIDANDNVYKWNGEELVDQNGEVVVDQVELEDAYGNVVLWNGTDLIPMSTEVKCDWSDLVTANDWIDTVLSKNGRKSTITIETVHSDVYTARRTSSGQWVHNNQIPRSAFSAATASYSAPEMVSTLSRAATPAVANAPASIQTMSLASTRASFPDLSTLAGNIVANMYQNPWYTNRGSGGYAGAVDSSKTASTINQYYIGDTAVTTMTEEQFAQDFIDLMDRYGRLART